MVTSRRQAPLAQDIAECRMLADQAKKKKQRPTSNTADR